MFTLYCVSCAQSIANPNERIVFNTDRDLYLSGEDIWFAGMVVSEEIPSKVIYIEVFNNDRELVARSVYNSIDGVFSGKINLPSYIETGYHLIRIYSNYLRNYPTWQMPVKVIKVVNATAPLPRFDSENSKPKFALSEVGELCFQLPNDRKFKDIQLFRGQMPLDTSIIYFNNGLGKINSELDYYDSLYLNVTYNDHSSEKISIPELSNNLICSIKSSGSNYKVNINSTEYESGIISLRTTDISHGSVETFNSELIEGEASFSFDISSPGLYFFEFEINNQNITSFVKFLNNEELTHNRYAELTIETATIEGTGELEFGKLSHYLLKNPMYLKYIHNTYKLDKIPELQLNILLTVNGDDLRNIIGRKKKTDTKFIKETNGPVINGQFISDTVMKSIDIFCSFISDESKFLVGRTDETGRFAIELGSSVVPGDVYISVKERTDGEIKILNNYCNEAPIWNPVNYLPDSSDTELLTRMYINSQFEKVYTNSIDKDSIPENCYLPLMSGNLTTYRMSDYIQMASTQELINEVVMFVRVRNTQDGYRFAILDDKTRVIYNDPLVILDNIYYPDVDKIMKLQPSEITHIDVISRKYFYGPTVFNGVIRINTTTGIREDMDIPGGGVFFKYEPPNDFMQMDSRNKELSNTLFWRVTNSDIKKEYKVSKREGFNFRTIVLTD